MTRRLCIALSASLWAATACAQADSPSARGESYVDPPLAGAPRLTGDPVAVRADSLVQAGRARRAPRLVAPRLRGPAAASPGLSPARAGPGGGWGGDTAGGARAYRSVGAEGGAFRAEGLAARDDAAKTALARRILAYLGETPNAIEARQALEVLDNTGVLLSPAREALDVLDKTGVVLSPPEELDIARAAADYGSATRAVAGFERAMKARGAALLSPADQLAYAGALLRAGRAREAAQQYGALLADPTIAPLASYQRARALLQAGDGAGARSALRATVAS